jgi:RimJ/RimL family protein N-acetyltransferase
VLGPVIDGERVRLEPPRAEHLPTYVRWFADMEVTRYLLFRFPLTEKGEAEWFEQTAKDPHKVVWAIVAQTSGRLVGATSLDNINWRDRRSERRTSGARATRAKPCGCAPATPSASWA